MIGPDGDPSLAAEPGFHDQTPDGAEVVAGPFGQTFDILPVLMENFTKNPLPCGGMEPETAAGVVIDLAGGQSPEAAQAAMIELMGNQLDFQNQRRSFHQRGSRKNGLRGGLASGADERPPCSFSGHPVNNFAYLGLKIANNSPPIAFALASLNCAARSNLRTPCPSAIVGAPRPPNSLVQMVRCNSSTRPARINAL